MTSRISRPAYGTDFSTILNEFWTDFLQFSAKDGGGGVSHPPTPPLMCAPARQTGSIQITNCRNIAVYLYSFCELFGHFLTKLYNNLHYCF